MYLGLKCRVTVVQTRRHLVEVCLAVYLNWGVVKHLCIDLDSFEVLCNNRNWLQLLFQIMITINNNIPILSSLFCNLCIILKQYLGPAIHSLLSAVATKPHINKISKTGAKGFSHKNLTSGLCVHFIFRKTTGDVLYVSHCPWHIMYIYTPTGKIPCCLFVTMIEDLSQIKCMTHILGNTYKYDFTQSRQRKLMFSAFNGGLLLYVAEEVPYVRQAEHNAHERFKSQPDRFKWLVQNLTVFSVL